MFPRYFRYSILTILVESTGMGGDRMINGSYSSHLLTSSYLLNKEKRKQKN